MLGDVGAVLHHEPMLGQAPTIFSEDWRRFQLFATLFDTDTGLHLHAAHYVGVLDVNDLLGLGGCAVCAVSTVGFSIVGLEVVFL